MRRLCAFVFGIAMMGTAQAQWAMLAPTPLGVVVTAGQWVWLNSKQVYYVEVRGSGPTVEQARMNGFRLAVEQALGTVIASETESERSQIRRDQVISYAAGFVERSEIVDTVNLGSNYEIRMKVWVQRNNLAERLLVKSQADGQIAGEQASIAVNTAQYSRNQGDQVLNTVLKDFPERSFDIKLEPTRVEMTPRRGAELLVPFDITWSKKYIDSFFSAYQSVRSCGWGGCTIDQVTGDLLHNEFVNSRPQLLLTLYSSAGTVKYRYCTDMEPYTVRREPFINLDFRHQSKYVIPVRIEDLPDLKRAEIRIVRLSNCPSQVLFNHKY